ncbi:GPKOW protein, partial [Anthoscopus minutus]|nr:GPKOW protein [Anthoscopus minutus]
IEDLLTPDTCVCRTDDGRLVEGETPPPEFGGLLTRPEPPKPLCSERVMVVLGKHAGQVGRILEREPERGRALVQLGRDTAAPQVLPLPYDSICHYLGGGDDD